MKLKSLIIAALAVLISSAAEIRAEFAKDPDVCDMALVYSGAKQRPVWNKDQLRHYVTHTFADGHSSWFFDSFLFIEFTTSKNGDGRSFGTKYNNGSAAKKTDWIDLLHLQMGDQSHNSCYALNELISELKPQLGTPVSKHTVVFTMPIAVKDYARWGEIDGRTLDFANINDRIDAQKWYIDQLLELWNEMNFENLDLIGFYWVDEFISEDVYFTDVVSKAISEYLHTLGLKLYWIPYNFSNPGNTNWQKYGMDLCMLQPNYMFKLNTGAYPSKTKLLDAISYAKNRGMSLEVEFEADGLWDDNIPDNQMRYGRLGDYLDAFTSKGVFDVATVSWYSGTQGLLDMSRSTHPKNIEMIDRIASIVEERHSRMWEVAGVGNVETDVDTSFATAGNGYISIAQGHLGAAIYSTSGAMIARGSGDHHVAPGIYVVTDGSGNSVKLAVR